MSMNRDDFKGNSLLSTFHADDGIDIKKTIELLYRHIWIISATGFATFFIALLYTFTIKPEYMSSTLVQITSHSSTTANVMANPFNKNNESTTQAQLALLKTRYVLEPLVISSGLNIVATPKYFPFFGQWKTNHYKGDQLAPAFLGLKSYAWGGEKINIKQFSVPSSMIGQNFKLVVEKNAMYKLYSSAGVLILTGKVGISSTTKDGISLEVAALKARPATEFNLSYQSPISIAQSLGKNMRINSVQGNDPTVNTGISEIQYINGNPEQTVSILNAIMSFATLKNSKQKTFETQKTLDFLNQKLPELSAKIQKSEEEVVRYHSQKGVFTAAIASQTLTERWETLSQSLELLKTEREELLQIYTPVHPMVISLEYKIKRIENELEKTKKDITTLPSSKLVEQHLADELKLKNELFDILYHNKQQLELTKAGIVSDIRILTDATPAVQMPAHKFIIILFGLLSGLFAASLVILVRNLFVKTIENAEQLEAIIHLPIQAIIPFSRKQKQMEKSHIKLAYATPLILAKYDHENIAIESLRSLHINLQITKSLSNQVIAFMGSMTNIGKSFVSLNFAQVLAESGKKVLLIDADVRRGRLHQALLEPKDNGLSEYLEGKLGYSDLVRQIHENLFFVPSGIYSNHPIELFRSIRFKEFIEQVRSQFDHVIIDTPPILPVTDSLLIAQHCDIKLFIVSAGKDTMVDVKHAIKKALANKIEISGIVLNHRKPSTPYGLRSEARYSYKTMTS